ncbi:MAG: VOC family protein [Candidatus Hodarchaeales archaeon]|jgi:predicted enzyme related to lactoylglutathione lyase
MAKKKRGRKAATPKKGSAKKSTEIVHLSKIYDSTSIYTTHPIMNYEISKKFYEEVLEFPVNLEIPMAGWYEFRLPVKGALLGLSQYREESGDFKPANSLNISISDVEKAKASLESKGVSTSDIIDYPDMVSMISFEDPDKNNIFLIGPPRVKSSEK